MPDGGDEPMFLRHSLDFESQARLPNPRLSRNDGAGTIPLARLLEHFPQDFQLGFAPDER